MNEQTFKEGVQVRFDKHPRPSKYLSRLLGREGIVKLVMNNYHGKPGNVRYLVHFEGVYSGDAAWLKSDWLVSVEENKQQK